MNAPFGMWGRRGRRHRHGRCEGERGFCLEACEEDTEWMIATNPDRKMVEMGLCRGCVVRVLKNSPRDANMVVAVGDCRYVIGRSAAACIRVCRGD